MLLVRFWNDQIQRKWMCKLCNSQGSSYVNIAGSAVDCLLRGYVHKDHLIVAHNTLLCNCASLSLCYLGGETQKSKDN